MLKNRKEFKKLCKKLFNSTESIVDKDEARSGILGYHPLALLVIALDHISELEKDNKFFQKKLEKWLEHAKNYDPYGPNSSSRYGLGAAAMEKESVIKKLKEILDGELDETK